MPYSTITVIISIIGIINLLYIFIQFLRGYKFKELPYLNVKCVRNFDKHAIFVAMILLIVPAINIGVALILLSFLLVSFSKNIIMEIHERGRAKLRQKRNNDEHMERRNFM